MNISSNMASINSHQTMMNTSANNVANLNTDGFRPSDTRISNSDGSSPQASTRLSADTGSTRSQTDVAKELTDQIIAQDVTAVNVSSMKTQDEMLGSLLDVKA